MKLQKQANTLPSEKWKWISRRASRNPSRARRHWPRLRLINGVMVVLTEEPAV